MLRDLTVSLPIKYDDHGGATPAKIVEMLNELWDVVLRERGIELNGGGKFSLQEVQTVEIRMEGSVLHEVQLPPGVRAVLYDLDLPDSTDPDDPLERLPDGTEAYVRRYGPWPEYEHDPEKSKSLRQ